MATDTSTILAGNPFKVLASTASASASAVVQLIPEEDVPITDDVINEKVADDIAPPEQALSEQAKDVDTMESQKMSALEHSLTRNKEKNEEVKPVSASAILLHHSACIMYMVCSSSISSTKIFCTCIISLFG